METPGPSWMQVDRDNVDSTVQIVQRFGETEGLNRFKTQCCMQSKG